MIQEDNIKGDVDQKMKQEKSSVSDIFVYNLFSDRSSFYGWVDWPDSSQAKLATGIFWQIEQLEIAQKEADEVEHFQNGGRKKGIW